MALDYRPPSRRVARQQRTTQAAHEEFLSTLAHLPEARQGPTLRSSHSAIGRPMPSRGNRKPQSMMTRLAVDERRQRLTSGAAVAMIFVVVVTLFAISLFG